MRFACSRGGAHCQKIPYEKPEARMLHALSATGADLGRASCTISIDLINIRERGIDGGDDGGSSGEGNRATVCSSL